MLADELAYVVGVDTHRDQHTRFLSVRRLPGASAERRGNVRAVEVQRHGDVAVEVRERVDVVRPEVPPAAKVMPPLGQYYSRLLGEADESIPAPKGGESRTPSLFTC
jgi:hypothetical protein